MYRVGFAKKGPDLGSMNRNFTVKFLNLGMPEMFPVIYLKFKQRGQTHTCDKFKKGITGVSFSLQGGFSKMYRTYRKFIN